MTRQRTRIRRRMRGFAIACRRLLRCLGLWARADSTELRNPQPGEPSTELPVGNAEGVDLQRRMGKLRPPPMTDRASWMPSAEGPAPTPPPPSRLYHRPWLRPARLHTRNASHSNTFTGFALGTPSARWITIRSERCPDAFAIAETQSRGVRTATLTMRAAVSQRLRHYALTLQAHPDHDTR